MDGERWKKAMKPSTTRMAAEIAIAAIITFAVAEIGLRILNQFYPQPFFYTEHSYRFRAKPHQKHYDFVTNSNGFNDIEHNRETPKDTFRIVSIGDSFAFGVVPFENNYNTLLTRGLTNDGYNVELINMGVPAAAPRNYVTLLKEEGVTFNPNLVLVSFFIGNDFEAIEPPRQWHSFSFVLSFLKYAYDISSRLNIDVTGNKNANYVDNAKTFTDEEYNRLEAARSWAFKKNSNVYDIVYKKTIDQIAAISETCRKINAPLVIAIIPDELQVNADLRKSALPTGRDTDYDFDQPNKMLASSLNELGIKYIDLLPRLREESKLVPVYKPNDSHWNIRGNLVAAQELKIFLESDKALLGDARSKYK